MQRPSSRTASNRVSTASRSSAKDGVYRQSCVLNEEQCTEPYEDFSIEWRTLTGDDADYSGMARAYRTYQLDRGAVKPFTERVKGNDALKYAVEAPEIRIRLTQVEYAILKLFMQNPGRALSREDILAAVWGRDYDGELKIVDVNIRRLRIKIEDDTANPTYITTVWGLGYKWGA